MKSIDENNKGVQYKNCVLEQELLSILLSENEEFVPPLSTYVNVQEWTKKLITNAEFSCFYDGDKLVGVVAIYCNDEEKRCAHIPLVVIKSEYVNQGLASFLINKALGIAKQKGMYSVTIETQSNKALCLYQNLGFDIVGNNKRGYFLQYLL